MAKGKIRMLRSAAAGIDAVEAETRQSFARHTHDQFGIGLIYEGAQKSLSGRGIVEAGAGDMITVNPGEVHDGTPIGDAGRAWRMLYFDPSVIATAAEDISQGRAHSGEFTAPAFHDREVAEGTVCGHHRSDGHGRRHPARGAAPAAACRRSCNRQATPA
jgi:quercetin dioxygenase-like cupin family protein